jgi:hypothetical protein
MALRARTLLAVSLVAIPCLAYTCPAFGHNGRDGAPPPLQVWLLARAPAKAVPAPPPAGKFIDIYQGIVVKVDPKTGVRSYVQVGDAAANPARARSTVPAGFGPGPDYWVNKEFEKNQSAPMEASYAYQAPATQVSSYDDYGGYYPAYGYGYGYGGGYGGRPGGGHDGGDRPGHGGGDGGDHPPPRTSGIVPQPYRPSAPAGPYGGGVGSPPPYNFGGVGAPPPEQPRVVRSRRG